MFTNKINTMQHILLLLLALFAVIQGANLSTRYAEKVAESFRMSKYVVGFIVVSFISVLPETFIAIGAAMKGNTELGIGTILGSNVADLTLIMAILAFVAGRKGVKVERASLRRLLIYPLFLAIPLLLALDGSFSRSDGLVLIIVGIIFYVFTFRRSVGISSRSADIKYKLRNAVYLALSLALLLLGAHFTVDSTVALASNINISPVLIGILVVGLGTTIPELSFASKAIKHGKHEMAVGDVLGSVLADATIVIGIVSMIGTVTFPPRIAYVAGGFMVFASVVLIAMFKSKHKIDRREAIWLVLIWVAYVIAEVVLSSTTTGG